jgi:hypothetical protein
MDLCKDVVIKVIKELDDISTNDKLLDEFKAWMKDEYINYMLASREEFSKTLKRFKTMSSEFTPYIKVLENNIDSYGATQAFFRVGRGER